jgi:hypothetical protein
MIYMSILFEELFVDDNDTTCDRYNNWQHDPLSHNNSAHAIAARYDLVRDPALFELDGGIDAKVSSFHMAQALECEAVLGPSNDQQPTFAWTDDNNNATSHWGQPDVFNFTFVKMRHFEHIAP